MVKTLTLKGSGEFFDIRPIELEGFRLLARSVRPIGKPTLKQWIAAAQFAGAAETASGYWIGDLLRYAETRTDWTDRLDQAIALTGWARQTMINLTYVARHVEEPERQLAPSLAHAAQVAPLERPEQTKWLEKARTEGWTVRDLRMEIRAASRKRVLDGQAILEGMYRVLYADPPWLYGDSGATKDGSLGKAARHYPGMTIEELCKLPVQAHALPDSVLFCWVTAPMLLENPGPREVIEAWGFKPKTGIVWDKVLHNWGHYVGVHHEHLIIATRGSCMPDNPTPLLDSVQTVRRSGEHSEKPEEFRAMITRLYSRGPYLELFGRKKVKGWSVFGNDARLWAGEAVGA